MVYIFFTKTNLNEPPRLRHQVLKLILEYEPKAKVFFFEKPKNLFSFNRNSPINQPLGIDHNGRLKSFRLTELLHHKLRLVGILSWLNEKFILIQIKKLVRRLKLLEDVRIINFNYDYYFLNKFFSQNDIITIINDDFPETALFGYKKPLNKALFKTINSSHKVLTVSRQLQEKLINISRDVNIELFYPWFSGETDFYPYEKRERKIVFWGYINRRLDFELIELISKDLENISIKIDFVGPIESDVERKFRMLIDNSNNINYLGEMNLSKLNEAKYLAAIIPYRSGDPVIEAVEISNKTFQLLSIGLPIVTSGMPKFIEAPFIGKAKNFAEDFLTQLSLVTDRCYIDGELCNDIQSYIIANHAAERYRQFKS